MLSKENNNSPKLNEDQKEQKIINYLDILENIYSRDDVKESNHKRSYKINKALKSIKRNSNCHVSKFSPGKKEKQDLPTSPIKPKENPQAEAEADDLLKMLEHEVTLSPMSYEKQSNCSTPVKNNKDKKRLSKLFLKMELKLKTHIQKHKMRKSITTDAPQFTLSQKKNSYLPKLKRNFFSERESGDNKINRHQRNLFKGQIRSSFKMSMQNKSNVKKHLSFSEIQENKANVNIENISHFDIFDLMQNEVEDLDFSKDERDFKEDELEIGKKFSFFKENKKVKINKGDNGIERENGEKINN